MIRAVEVVHLLVFLILNCHSRQGVLVMAGFHSNQNLPQQNTENSALQQESRAELVSSNSQEQQQQAADASSIQATDHLNDQFMPVWQRIVNSDGSTATKLSTELRTLLDLMKLLESIGILPVDITTSSSDPAVLRKELNQLTNGEKSSFRQQQQQQASGEFSKLNENGSGAKKPPSGPIYWFPYRTGSNYFRTQPNNGPIGNPYHRFTNPEAALHTPKHSRSVNDYEFKRVENSRWNNLRGMWGKRSSNRASADRRVDVSPEEDLFSRPAGDE